MSAAKPPKMLTDAGLSVFENAASLRELPLPISEIPIEELLWHFDMPVWEKDGTDDWNLTPWQVIRGEEGSLGHRERVAAVDTRYPLIVTNYNKRLVILDGVHRLVKCFMDGETTIRVKIVPIEHLSRREF